MTDLALDELRASVADGWTLPSSWYTDPAIFRAEQEMILRRSWHYVTHTGNLSSVGDTYPCDIGGVPVVLVRTADGVRGYENICRHRAHPVVMEAGNTNTMQCIYHGWTYDLDGSLRHVPRANGEVPADVAAMCLPQVQVHVWGPTVWVNPSLDAPSWSEWVEQMPDMMLAAGCDVSEYEHAVEHTWDVEANWKVHQDNSIECYHCPTTHPEFSRAFVMDPTRQQLVIGGRYWIHHTIPFRGSDDDGTDAGGDDGSMYGRVRDGRPPYFFNWIFPATYVQTLGGGFDVGSVEAIAVDRIRWRHSWFGPPGTTAEARALGTQALASDPTINQDVAICKRVQHSHESGVAPAGRLLPGREELLMHYYKLIVEMMSR